MDKFVVVGPIVHCTDWGSLSVTESGLVAVENGKIVACGPATELGAVQRRLDLPQGAVAHLGPSRFLMPGLVDTHIHAPQYPNAGLGLDQPLLDWLNTYTFPLEKQFDDLLLAQRVYKAVVNATLGSGTTTACYFATIHPHSSTSLARACAALGQRAFVGKVNMNLSNEHGYFEAGDSSLANTTLFIEEIRKLNNPLVQPIITPRFSLSCDMTLMKQLGELAAAQDLPIQTHIAENETEVQLVKEAFPGCKHYACTYDCAQLLTKKTILAHGIYLSDEEVRLVAERGCAVSHCPKSNQALKSGNCDVTRLVEAGINVGLGTDVSGGYSASIVDVMRSCLDVSTQLHFQDPSHKPLTYQHALYLATLGGAKALSLGEVTGNFEVGKEFDALVVSPGWRVDLLPVREYGTLDLVQKFVYCGDDRNISQVFVRGRLVKTREELFTGPQDDRPTFFSH